ncbi:hypothetical protein F0562_018139 [Nyssa sinensis]|uniref:Uncharacterized protein n=1 Tax=Nyssa sinensis TaxID=561372 RepID=A0A5J4ZBI3_9ASTE|nr:hypothetical protein F0562_018139 [Nyssa sinensis]
MHPNSFSLTSILFGLLFAVITGGLDSKLVLWDFPKGRPYKIVDFGAPDVDSRDKSDNICVAARGVGVVHVINIEAELAAIKSESSSKPQITQSRSKGSVPPANTELRDQNGRKKLLLDYSLGGHIAAVS